MPRAKPVARFARIADQLASTFSTAAAMRNSAWSWPLRASSISPTGSLRRERQRDAAKIEEIADRGVAQQQRVARGEDSPRIGDLGDASARQSASSASPARRDAASRMIHRAHQTLACMHHVDIVGGRHGAAALDARPHVRVDIGAAPRDAGRDGWRKPPAARCRHRH